MFQLPDILRTGSACGCIKSITVMHMRSAGDNHSALHPDRLNKEEKGDLRWKDGT
jgi:hypothetical protein